MKPPNHKNAIVSPPKIVDYLLNLSSENGKTKAHFFMAFGFTIEEWEQLAEALIRHASTHEVAKVELRPPFGIHYVVDGTLETPDKRNPAVRVVWIIDEGDDFPRLISAYPL